MKENAAQIYTTYFRETMKELYLEITKLNKELEKYKNLEEKLGCSLDIIFDALYNGIVCTPHPFYDHKIIYPKKEYNVVQLFQFYYLKVEDGVVDIKDYGKTWWIKKDKSE